MKSGLPRERVLSLLDYDQSTGVFLWKPRPSNKQWTSANGGKRAGHLNPKGYRIICIDAVPYYAHRLAWLMVYGKWPSLEIDHKNLKCDDNSIANLREATKAQQRCNQAAHKRNKSGFKGVAKVGDKWQASFASRYLGLHASPEAAHAAYCRAAAEAAGEFFRAA